MTCDPKVPIFVHKPPHSQEVFPKGSCRSKTIPYNFLRSWSCNEKFTFQIIITPKKISSGFFKCTKDDIQTWIKQGSMSTMECNGWTNEVRRRSVGRTCRNRKRQQQPADPFWQSFACVSDIFQFLLLRLGLGLFAILRKCRLQQGIGKSALPACKLLCDGRIQCVHLVFKLRALAHLADHIRSLHDQFLGQIILDQVIYGVPCNEQGHTFKDLHFHQWTEHLSANDRLGLEARHPDRQFDFTLL